MAIQTSMQEKAQKSCWFKRVRPINLSQKKELYQLFQELLFKPKLNGREGIFQTGLEP